MPPASPIENRLQTDGLPSKEEDSVDEPGHAKLLHLVAELPIVLQHAVAKLVYELRHGVGEVEQGPASAAYDLLPVAPVWGVGCRPQRL